jgi:hypothetical protein
MNRHGPFVLYEPGVKYPEIKKNNPIKKAWLTPVNRVKIIALIDSSVSST